MIYVYESLSGFLTICPDLVLMILPFCGIVILSPGVFIVFCLLSSLSYLSALLIMYSSLLPCWMHLFLLVALCIINVTSGCMHFTICHWIVTNRF